MFTKFIYKSQLLGLCAGLLCCLSLAEAREIEGLYRAEVPVMAQQRAERIKVYPAALSQVVVKLSGNRATPGHPDLLGPIANAARLVQQFHYRDLPEEGYLGLKEEGYRHLLVVEFDAEAVTQMLVEAAVPLWGRTRPELLLWLAVEDRGARYLLATNASLELESYLTDASRRRGLPLLLPLLDLEDQMQLGFADVWGDFRQSIVQASERYGADAVLVGRLYRPFDGPWQARWSLYQQDDVLFWQGQGDNQKQTLAEGIEAAADRLAQNYAQILSLESAGRIEVRVTDINDLADYARAMAYLGSLDAVNRVEVGSVYADEVIFQLNVRGEVDALERAIGLGGTLKRVSGIRNRNVVHARTFVYQLLP